MPAETMRLLVLLALAGCARPDGAPPAPVPDSRADDSVAPIGPDDPLWAFRFMAPETVPEAARQAAVRARVPLDTMGRGPWGEPVSPAEIRALAAAVDTSAAGTVALIGRVGVYHAGEVTARTGERWQGFYPGVGLRSLRLTVEPARDPVLDDEGEPMTGVRVRTPFSVVADDAFGYPEDDALFLVRRPGRPFGPAATAFAGVWPATTGRLTLALGGVTYTLEVYEGPETTREYDGTPVRPDRVLVLAHGDGRRQPVSNLSGGDAGAPELWWAGDLDGDGRLDLVVNETTHYNLTAPALFLSSEARPGALVRRVARHETVGC